MQVHEWRQVLSAQGVERAVEALRDVPAAEGLAHHHAVFCLGQRVVALLQYSFCSFVRWRGRVHLTMKP